jgi:hypothetical protein
MTDHLVLRRLLWALTSIVLLVGVMAIPVVGDDDGGDRATGVRTDRSGADVPAGATTAAPGPGAGEGGDGGDGGGAPPASTPPNDSASPSSVPTTSTPAPTSSTTPPTFPPPASDLGAPVDPGPVVAPKPGVYRYRTTGGGEDGERETSVRVEERGRNGDEVRLGITIAADGLTITNEETWRPEGVRTLRSTFVFGEQRAECDWEPDVVEAAYPLRAGATWTSDSTCPVTVGATTVVARRTIRAEVVDLRRVRVAGEVVDVWAIRRVEELSVAGRSGTTTALALFSPKHGIDVDVQGSASGAGQSGDYHQELVRLQPDPL